MAHSWAPSSSQAANGSQNLRPRPVNEVCEDDTPLPPLRIADNVVWLSDNGPEFGIVKWLGKIPDIGDEWMAGVEFVNPVGSGTGLYNEHQLFETRMNHASLVPIVCLMKATDYVDTSPQANQQISELTPNTIVSQGSYSSQRANNSQSQTPLHLNEVCADGTPPPSLRISDKVVWLSDNGPEYGIVKWLGKIPDVGDEWMAGVEFVNPVGSGTGMFNEHKLFETRMNHASLMPVIGLMKAIEYLGTSSKAERQFEKIISDLHNIEVNPISSTNSLNEDTTITSNETNSSHLGSIHSLLSKICHH